MDLLESIEIDYNSGLPVWVQLRNRAAYLIMTGAYSEGDRLPTVRALATALDISYNTANRAYMELEREGLISTRRGRGTFVLEIDPSKLDNELTTVDILAEEMIDAALNIGMDRDSIVKLVLNKLNC